jgi:hypothetical protein
VRIDGRTHWELQPEGFRNDLVVIHIVRNSRAASVVTETMAGHQPTIWVSDLYGAQQRHADLWPVYLAHQLRDCQYAIETGDTIFAPHMWCSWRPTRPGRPISRKRSAFIRFVSHSLPSTSRFIAAFRLCARITSAHHAVDPDQPFRPIVITDSGGVHPA